MAGLRIGALTGGGLVLGWRCPSRCRHCLYGCGPHRADGAPADGAALEALLDRLHARAPRARWHIGGGEPFLDAARLRSAIDGMTRCGMALDYVETNASWVKDAGQAAEVLRDLARAGLAQVLVSLSPFHAEHVPTAKALALARAAEEALPNGAFVWIPEFLEDLEAQPEDERLDFDALVAARGGPYALALARRYSTVPAGRAGRYFAAHGAARPWRELPARAPCASRLADTTHFHVDGQGLYVPGLCAGFVLPWDEVPGEIDLGKYPVLRAVVERGLAGLVELATERGFRPLEAYGSPCDLCTHARFALAGQGHAELGPAGFYDARSVAY